MADCTAAARFGTLADGTAVHVWTLSSASGMSCAVLDYGGIIQSLHVPDRHGNIDDVVLGFDSLEEYVAHSPYFGAIVGRHANRIAGGRLVLDGQLHQLTQNDGNNHLHGGAIGFDKVVWTVQPFSRGDAAGLVLGHRSAAGTEGYPANIDVTVTYTLTDDNALTVSYHAVADAPTVVNLSQHSYFNLTGHASGNVLDHHLAIDASSFVPVNDELIPIGVVQPVDATPFDFRASRRIGERIDSTDDQLLSAGGYDHNWVLDDAGGSWQVHLAEPHSGRLLRIRTTEPGVQFYTGNMLDGVRGKASAMYRRHAGLCLETQHFPDAPNHPAFPDTIIRPGMAHRSTTTYMFSVIDE